MCLVAVVSGWSTPSPGRTNRDMTSAPFPDRQVDSIAQLLQRAFKRLIDTGPDIFTPQNPR